MNMLTSKDALYPNSPMASDQLPSVAKAAKPELYIVDDNADFRFLARNIFQKYLTEYNVRIFSSGQSLYQHLMLINGQSYTGALPGLVILDLQMPGIGGLPLLKLMRQRLRSTKVQWKLLPVVILSSLATDQQTIECYQAGATSVINKPAHVGEHKALFETVCMQWLQYNQPG